MNHYLRKQLITLKCSLINRNVLKQIAISEENLSLLDKDLMKLQWKKLKQLLSYAYTNCPFYYEKYNEVGLRPEDIHNLEDFKSVPIVTKAEIRNNLERFLPTEIDMNLVEEVCTSGTTGDPLRIYRDKSKKDLMYALYLRTIRLWGCDIGSKIAWMWGILKDREKLDDYRYQSKTRRFIKNETWYNTFEITKENMRQFSQFLNKFRPQLIISHVSALYEYAQFLSNNMIRIPAPLAIWITAEPIDLHQRKVIETAFGAKTYNQYGTSEVLHIAAECSERSGLHIHADSRYVEIVDSNGAPVSVGELGNVVVTDLENRVMPLIRYRNDDVSSLLKEHCSCGLNLPLMNNVVGRVLDTIKLKNGRRIFGHIFARILFEHSAQVKQFQVHQISLDRIIIRIVPGKIDDIEKLEFDVLNELKQYTDNLVNYSFEIKEQIERERSGKLRYVKSDV